ncbi:MAG: hypothetical protein HY261_02900 [Chloroflexi bacterium]|nr:hypothetical protein [Chloroflexota bacterium]
MSASTAQRDPMEINVGIIGVGVVGSAVLDFFARGPIEVPVPGARFSEPSVAKVRIWSAARRSRNTPKGASEAFIQRLVTHDERGQPRYYYDSGPNEPQGNTLGPAWREIVRDPDVDIVVELTGSPVAEGIIEQALWHGKCVVTANKGVLSRSGYELVRLAQSRGTALAYEACVGGGMPVVQTIGAAIGGRVTALLAIINGTTNYILTEMQKAVAPDPHLSGSARGTLPQTGEGKSGDASTAYPAAVCAAIHGGLAEADPSADVLGEDARAKVIILAGLAFGMRLRPLDVYVRGIARRGVSKAPPASKRAAHHACPGAKRPCPDICGNEDHVNTQPIFHAPDLQVLQRLGYVPKLLAGAQLVTGLGPGERAVAWVQPAAVPATHALALVTGSENACLLDVESPVDGGKDPHPPRSESGRPLPQTGEAGAKRYSILLRGPGAGGPETASSVIADIQFCARQIAAARVGGDIGREDGQRVPMYMYGANAFREAIDYPGVPSLCMSDRLVAPFLLRFLTSGSDGAKLAKSLAGCGVEAEALEGVKGYVYLKTAPVSVRVVERAIESVLLAQGAGRMPLDVLYLPIIEGARWEERD